MQAHIWPILLVVVMHTVGSARLEIVRQQLRVACLHVQDQVCVHMDHAGQLDRSVSDARSHELLEEYLVVLKAEGHGLYLVND